MVAALIVIGAPGAGKSSVLQELSSLLEAERIQHGSIESEQLSQGLPLLPAREWIPQPAEVLASRLRAREADRWAGRARLIAHARGLARVVPRLEGVDVVIDTGRRAAEDVAVEILAQMRAQRLLASS